MADGMNMFRFVRFNLSSGLQNIPFEHLLRSLEDTQVTPAPGRPVAAAVHSVTYNVSKFLSCMWENLRNRLISRIYYVMETLYR